MTARSIPLLAAIAFFLCTLAPPLSAGSGGKGNSAHKSGRAAGLTSAEAAKAARRQTGGRVLNVKPAKGGYRVKVLTPEGEVINVPVASGSR